MRTMILLVLLTLPGCAHTKSKLEVTAQAEENKPAVARAAWSWETVR